MKIGSFKTNKDAEVNGLWQDLDVDCKVLIARANNPKYTKELRRISAPHKQMARRGVISEDVLDKILIKVMAKTILLNWEGIEDDDGNPIEYSQEAAISMLTDYPDFREMIASMADDMSIFREDNIDEVTGQIKK